MNRSTDPRFSQPPHCFWEALNLAQREEFKSLAQQRIFAGGVTLINEGEPGSHVIVILSGRAKIYTSENGQDRVIAERGPGQLIGELAAVRVSVRSATVAALETVKGLVMRTQDFADFISAHPDVLRIVESQVSDRLAEAPIVGQPYEVQNPPARRPTPAEINPVAVWSPGQPTPRRLIFRGENCTVVANDVVEFSASYRNDDDRLIIRKALLEMTWTTLGELSHSCHCEDRGDGLLIVAPADIPTMNVLRPLHDVLPYLLRRHNRTYGPCAQMQLRVASDVGPVVSDTLGVQGEAIIRTARLLDAPTLREAIASEQASLGIVVSPFVYETAIRQPGGPIDEGGYTEIQVQVKESSQQAWMKIIDPATPSVACLGGWPQLVATAPPGTQRSLCRLGVRESSYQ